MATRCRHCNTPVQRAVVSLRHVVANRTFSADAIGRPCSGCGVDGVDEEVRRKFALLVAAQLSAPNGPSVKFIREALRLRATDVAALLDVSLETLSRWENDRSPIPRAAHLVLVAMVHDVLDGRSQTVDMLQRLAEPRAKRHVAVSLTTRRSRRTG